MNMMTQNSLVDQGKQEKDSTNVVPVSDAVGHKNANPSLPEMLRNYCLITNGSIVVDMNNVNEPLALKDFQNSMRYCKTVEIGIDGRKKVVSTVSKWLESPDIIKVYGITCAPGRPRICFNPKGERCLNTWQPVAFHKPEPGIDIGPWFELMEWLNGEKVEIVHDFIAHMLQKPQELPEFGIIHYTNGTQGVGRSTMFKVIAKLLGKHAGQGNSLDQMKAEGWGDDWAGKVALFQDEAIASNKERYQTMDWLKQRINEEVRNLNMKGGKKVSEWNACRWFIASNNSTPLPLDRQDRRFLCIYHDKGTYASVYGEKAKEELFAAVYALMRDPEGINAIGWYYHNRDISNFDPFRTPEFDEDKERIASSNESLEEKDLRHLIDNYPADIIPAPDISMILHDKVQRLDTGDKRLLAALGCVYDGAQLYVRRKTCKCWIIRNVDKWKATSNTEKAAEANAATFRAGVNINADVFDILAAMEAKK
ncbi:primase-helicase family protein [Escherichia coli]